MAAKGKIQVKLHLTPAAHAALQANKDRTGDTMSVTVEKLIDEVLVPEMEAQEHESHA